MDKFDIITTIQRQLGDHILAVLRKSDQRIYIDIAPQSVQEASRLMLDEFAARLQIATGVDSSDGYEVMYHWALDNEGFVITLRVLLDHASPELESIALMCPAAEWIEREIWELLGIQFKGHPDLRHLLLADDWPEGNYPMRHNHEVTT
ncbi:MAG: NADH-quinone oxidoreductase subunit C [Xanthomonadales bacterium]|nr:NADH-quinone oxidoreductase subunit C [Xanthomonadales bacterium]